MDPTMSIGTMMNFIIQNITPHIMFIYILLLLGVVFIIGKFGISWSLGIVMLLVLLSPIIIIVGEISWVLYLLFAIIFAIVVIFIFRLGSMGD